MCTIRRITVPMLGFVLACNTDQTTASIRIPADVAAPNAAVLPASAYTPSVWPQQGWFSDVNDRNLVVGMMNGQAVAMQLGGFAIKMKKGPGIWARAEAVNQSASIAGSIDVGTPQQPQWFAAFWSRPTSVPVLLQYPSFGNDINDHGFVVGTLSYNGRELGFIWDPSTGHIEDLLPLPGGTTTGAVAVNNDHVVLGFSDGGSPPGWHTVLWVLQGGHHVAYQVVPPFEGYDIGSAFDIVGARNLRAAWENDGISGYFSTVGTSTARAFAWSGLVAGHDDGVPAPGAWFPSATAFVADKFGATTYLPYPPGTWKASYGFGLNGCGLVVGQLWTQAGAQPALWDPGC